MKKEKKKAGYVTRECGWVGGGEKVKFKGIFVLSNYMSLTSIRVVI